MVKIEVLNIQRLHVGEYAQYMNSIDAIIAKYQPGELFIQNQYQLFKPALVLFDAAARVEQGNAKSEAVTDTNTLRNNTWKACSTRIESTLISPFADEQASAKVLNRIFEHYGDIRKMPINDETGYMSQLIADLLLPANAVHLQKVGLATWVPELKKENELFIKLFNERNAEEAVKKSVGNTSDARKVVDGYYTEMINIVNATVVLKQAKPAAYNFIAEMNNLIQYYKTVMAARNSRNKPNDPDKPTDDSK